MNLNFQTGIKLVLLSTKTDVNLKNIVSNSVGCCTQQTAAKVKPVSKSKLSTTIMVSKYLLRAIVSVEYFNFETGFN